MMTEEREELEQELEHVKELFELHSTDDNLKDDAVFEEDIDILLDWAAEIEKLLKE